MRKLVEAFLENHSTKDTFLFRIACGSCGAEYANKPLRFTKAEETAPTPQKKQLYDALYAQELQSARIHAVDTAAEQLNYCPVCKRLICNRCFLICDELDMCMQCAASLDESGTPVEMNILDLAITFEKEI